MAHSVCISSRLGHLIVIHPRGGNGAPHIIEINGWVFSGCMYDTYACLNYVGLGSWIRLWPQCPCRCSFIFRSKSLGVFQCRHCLCKEFYPLGHFPLQRYGDWCCWDSSIMTPDLDENFKSKITTNINIQSAIIFQCIWGNSQYIKWGFPSKLKRYL